MAEDNLTEQEALDQARADGIEFVDTFTTLVDGKQQVFDNKEDAENASDDGYIIQKRERANTIEEDS